jgi:hypothetical protein
LSIRPALPRTLVAVAASLTVIVGAVPMTASAADPVPLAARLLSEPYTGSGIAVTVSNMDNMAGLTTDGATVYMLRGNGNVVTTPLSALPAENGTGQSFNAVGTEHTVEWGSDGAPTLPGDIMRLSLAYSHGCLFITNDNNSAGNVRLYCISVSDWSVTEIAVPSGHELPVGYYYTYSSLIDFPDGRIGKVSQYTGASGGGYESTLRTYTVSGTGAGVTLAFSEDYVMGDSDNWATDEHGIATDGTYLYRIQWKSYTPNFKSWRLEAGSTASVVYGGQYTEPFSNMHYLAHDHVANRYLMGFYNGASFFVTTAADPGPGPGSPLLPAAGTPTSAAGGCTVSISNYDPDFTWGASATSGSASISSAGLLTVSGLAPGATTTITVSASRTGYPSGSTVVSCSALPADPPGAPTAVTVKQENLRGSFSWAAPSHTGASAIIDYTVQVQDAAGDDIAGATCTATGVTYCSVEGLDNGTAYKVVVAARNDDGVGPWSAAVDFLPGLPVGEALPGGPDSSDLTLNDNTPSQGGTVILEAIGFRPGTQVDFWIHSTPQLLGSAIANGAGIATLTTPLPAALSGSHTAQALGISVAGTARNLTQSLTIAARPGALASTGSDAMAPLTAAGLLLTAGLSLAAVGIVRRRRTRS